MKTAEDYRERVAAGAAFLDEKAPGWMDKVDLERLDVSSAYRCVTAQSVGDGDYWAAQNILGQSSAEAAERGFVFSGAELDELDPEGERFEPTLYAPLTQAWRELIEERRSS